MGHLIAAEEVRLRLKLSEVLFIPAGQPPLKVEMVISPVKHRVEMVRLAIASNPYFKLCTMEVDRPGPSYTVDTLGELQHQLGRGVELFFTVGLDILGELPRWKDPTRLVQLCKLVAVTRPSYNAIDLNSLEASIPGISNRIILGEMPAVGISSSDIRYRLAHGLPIKYLVPEGVEAYIYDHGLYRVS
jgi:nicotinate-nucleotide adenylyltransferase